VEINQPDRGRSVVADAGVTVSFDQVGVVPGAADDAWVGAVPPRGVEVARAGDVGHNRGEGPLGLVRGERPGQRPGGG
jgi:hypothetical protein